ncbi:MAG TPA: hypothetical protein VJH96_03660 [Patescibacteria group bacterium]|nr:hypothetical protein [Patescibacteria group bacterium]
MRERVEASAPARICFGGESLDWMKNGPSIVGAITLRTTTSVETLPTIGDHYIVYLESRSPIPSKTLRLWKDASWYTDPYLKFVESAVHLVKQDVKTPQSLAVTIDSEIPAKAGVSSSAAVTLATVAAAGAFFGLRKPVIDICEMAHEVERDKLKTGAGRMDFYACGIGSLLYLNCGKVPAHFEPYTFPDELGIVLVDTLTPHETKTSISPKRQRFHNGDPDMVFYADQAEIMVERIHALMDKFNDNREEIGDLINRFHCLLRDYVRSSTPLLDTCVATANKNGALGAKLTGSGMGGCMFALVEKEHLEKVALALQELPVRVYETTIVNKGVLTSTN